MLQENTGKSGRLGVAFSASASVFYCLIVIWYVTTFPDIGLRSLLPTQPNEQELLITQFVHDEGDILGPPVQRQDKLLQIARRPANNFLLYVHNLARLRSAQIPPGGVLNPGSDPSELKPELVPELVDISAGVEDKEGSLRRMVELVIRQPNSSVPTLRQRTYVAVKSPQASEFLMTIVWFLCQLGILLVAITALWQRPGDKVVRTFCLMCCASMVAFVGGFHWWILVASPLLNLPFIFCACLLPSVTLHFFCSFPRENIFLKTRRWLAMAVIYGPPMVAAGLIGFTYWAAFALSGASADVGQYSVFQKLAAISSGLASGGTLHFNDAEVCAHLLYVLRYLVYGTIVLSCVYFSLTVFCLSLNLMRTQNPVERRQTFGILIASLIATVPIAYTMYLAFYQKESFALGHAQFPMFVASGLFMVAYAHGMLKHRLILADELLMRGREYFVTSSLVTLATAIVLAIGAVATRVYALPGNSSIPLHLSLFVVLIIAIAFILWARDRIQAVVDQRFFSEKYQIDRTLKQLNRASGYLTDPSALAEITLGTCRDVMDASTASMLVREAKGNLRLIGSDLASKVPASLPPSILPQLDQPELIIRRIPASSRDLLSPVQQLLHDLKAELICLLRGETGVDGMIVLGKRTNGAPYSPEDLAFLQAIGQMTVLALHSSRANQNLSRLNDELKVKVDRIAEQQRQLSLLRAELTSLQHGAGEERLFAEAGGFDRGEIRGNSQQIEAVLEMARKAAASTSTVLIRGESGTGKELLARVVHRNSDRKDKPLITVNCAALAPSLLESELFGHIRGAYTGANSDKEGRFKAADGGTLFLDEIGDISLEVQVKLLRVLQERCFEPVGSNGPVNVDVRMIAATNRNLEAMIETGEFREDLYYRLDVISMTLPPLRDRREDLIELVFSFLNRSVQKTGKTIRQIEPEALAAIEQHRWPGNIRELENMIERAVVLADGDTIMLKDLPAQMTPSTNLALIEDARATPQSWSPDSAVSEAAGTVTTNTVLSGQTSDTNQDSERVRLVTALQSANGNKARAARSLNMPRSTFYSKLKKFGLAD
ncbi:sigma 54-interacting transcriptional regulator [Fuerstiella marisgermanici]|uniref:Transcriptional regulatory protein ZraR n=1 Tax=Fuerstiella marisgermanici TaxID=1891926 RepID=A0A1P8WI99_9PLAN|nr:sigma 54-interacting transcriptional regulator [Fuerstiella marisgermanici]APZ93784.1 Transcriptional regulatory protein ZraR [Fuerstiella marisgermanici]